MSDSRDTDGAPDAGRKPEERTVTGRWAKFHPEMQNVPGTPAHKLEMWWARYGKK